MPKDRHPLRGLPACLLIKCRDFSATLFSPPSHPKVLSSKIIFSFNVSYSPLFCWRLIRSNIFRAVSASPQSGATFETRRMLYSLFHSVCQFVSTASFFTVKCRLRPPFLHYVLGYHSPTTSVCVPFPNELYVSPDRSFQLSPVFLQPGPCTDFGRFGPG